MMIPYMSISTSAVVQRTRLLWRRTLLITFAAMIAGTASPPTAIAAALPAADQSRIAGVTSGGLSSFAAQPVPLVMIVEENRLRITGVNPGGEVLLFSCAKRTRNGRDHLETDGRLLEDTDRDGVISFEIRVPLRSVWIAFDSTYGTVASGAHPRFPLVVGGIGPALFRKDAADEIVALERESPRHLLLLARPGIGAWLLYGSDGGADDRDHEANGSLKLAFQDAKPLAGRKETAPMHLKNGDVVVIIDPGHLDISISQVTK